MYTEVEILNNSFINQAADPKLTSNNIVRLIDVNESRRLPFPRRN